MEFLNNVFEQRENPISDSSTKPHTRNLMKLNNDLPITNFIFLKEPKHNHTTKLYYSNMYCTKEFKPQRYL